MTAQAGFAAALLAAAVPVIAEVKRLNADGVDLLAGRRPAALAAEYEAAGAACVSVVTGRWFGGDRELLHEVRRHTGLPILQKDFLVGREQLRRARADGVSAVLLTARIVPAKVLASLVAQALDLGLTPFVEVVDEEEVAQVAAAGHGGDCVVAVNNKDITRRERGDAELARSVALLPAVEATGTRCPVSASGIDGPQDAARLLAAGFAGLLVGSSLLRATAAGEWFARLAVAVAPVGGGAR